MTGLDRLLAPRRIALIGSTSAATGLGARTLRHLQQAGYPGTVTAVKADQLEPGTDVAVIAVPAAAAQQVVTEAATKAAYLIVYTAGFEEAGQPPLRLPPGSAARLIGPNSVGLYYRPTRTVLTFAAAFDDVAGDEAANTDGPGSGIFLVSQSGAFGARLVRSARNYGVTVDGFVGSGNETCYGACELAADAIESQRYRPRVLALYLESVRDGGALRRLLGVAAEHGVSVALLVGGESTAGAAAARSHTAAVTPGPAAIAALCDRYGAVRCGSDRELTEAMTGLSLLGRHPGRRVAVVTGSGGAGVVAADILARCGRTLPPPGEPLRARLAPLLPSYASVANPVDVTAQAIGDTATLAEVCRVLAGSGEVDSLLVVGRAGQAAELSRAVADRVPLVTCALDADPAAVAPSVRAGLAVLPGLEAACNVIRAVTADGAAPPGPDHHGGLPHALEAANIPDSPSTADSLELVTRAGIEAAPWRLARSPAEAISAGHELGWPVVVKANLPADAHKAQRGGIRLDVWPGNAEQAAKELLELAPALVVARQLRAGPELFAGIGRDPVCGLMITAGLGGGDVELAGRVVSVPADVPADWLRDRLATQVFQRGGRRYAPLPGLLAAAAAALASFAAHFDLALVECNPLVPAGDRLIALDARVIFHD